MEESQNSNSKVASDISVAVNRDSISRMLTSEEFDAKIINSDDCDEEDGNEDTRIDCISVDPVLND